MKIGLLEKFIFKSALTLEFNFLETNHHLSLLKHIISHKETKNSVYVKKFKVHGVKILNTQRKALTGLALLPTRL